MKRQLTVNQPICDACGTPVGDDEPRVVGTALYPTAADPLAQMAHQVVLHESCCVTTGTQRTDDQRGSE